MAGSNQRHMPGALWEMATPLFLEVWISQPLLIQIWPFLFDQLCLTVHSMEIWTLWSCCVCLNQQCTPHSLFFLLLICLLCAPKLNDAMSNYWSASFKWSFSRQIRGEFYWDNVCMQFIWVWFEFLKMASLVYSSDKMIYVNVQVL